MVESKIEKGEEAEEFGENEKFESYWLNPKKGEKVRTTVYVDKEAVEYVRKHYGSPSKYLEKVIYEYLKTIEEL